MDTLDSSLTIPKICELLTPLSTLCDRSYNHPAGLRLADYSDNTSDVGVEVLISSDHYWKLVTGNVRRGEDGPVAVETKLGWVLSNPVSSNALSSRLVPPYDPTTLMLGVVSEEVDLNKTLRAFWDLGSLGISKSDRSVLQDFKNTITFKGSCYEVYLPLRPPHPVLPDNYNLS